MVRKLGIYHVSQAARDLESSMKNVPEKATEPATFEEAIAAARFGRFHCFLMLVGVLPSSWGVFLSLTNVAIIIPSLKCDFALSVMEIGALNASPYIGSLLSPFLWGYLSDTMGRRKLLIYTAIADGVCIIMYAFSANVTELAVLKFISGFIMVAPAGIIITYLSECHCSKYRNIAILISGVLIASGSIIFPLIAWFILPYQFPYIKSWRIYLVISALPTLLSGFAFLAFFPESPKYLMSVGREKEALETFQIIYVYNTGQPAGSYPVSSLLCEKQTFTDSEKSKSFYEIATEKWNQFKPLFCKNYFPRLIACVIIQILLMMGVNTLRTWLPEIFTLMDNNQEALTVCQILKIATNKSQIEYGFNNITQESCLAQQTGDSVFIKLSSTGACSMVMFIVVTVLNLVINKKIVLGITLLISGVGGIGLTWFTDPILIWIISSMYTAQTGIALIAFMSIAVDIFPTRFRTLAMLLVMATGRFGCILGNLIFPMLVLIDCTIPFTLFGVGILICNVPLFLLPSRNDEDL